MAGPSIRNSMTNVLDVLFTAQGTPCESMELDYLRCGARVGHKQSLIDCKKEMDDYKECITQTKQNRRAVLMHAERRKQKKPYVELPPRDSYNKDMFGT